MISKALLFKIFLLIFPITVYFSNFILPMSGLALISVSLCVCFVSMCITFVGLHRLLQYKEPIPVQFFQDYMRYLGVRISIPQKKPIPKPNIDSVKKLTSELDTYFISKWYVDISKDSNFPNESRAFMEEVLTRLIDVQLQVNNKQVLHGVLNIFLRHLKEFRRSVKRREKYNCAIEDLYRYSHLCSTLNIKKPKDYFLQQLTINLLRHFINSELWNSLPCHILVSILARKFICYLVDLCSDPEVLNYLILTNVSSKSVQEKLRLKEYGRISLVQFFDTVDSKTVNIDNMENKDGIDGHDVIGNTEVKPLENETAADVKSEPITEPSESKPKEVKEDTSDKIVYRIKPKSHIQKDTITTIPRSPKKTDSVKIYEPKSTSKTWRDSRDLACISLGQDPLDALATATDGSSKNIKHNFWDTAVISEENKQDSPSSAAHIFNEVMNMTSMEGLKSSIKPISDATERTLHNIKDLQETTVHNALHKIGDFQDEAAGMVEGILDFGRAGFRKGLRLTGLQDNIENAKATLTGIPIAKSAQRSMRDQVKKKLEELRKSDSDSLEKISSAESVESVWINPLDSPHLEDIPEKSGKTVTHGPDKTPSGDSVSIPSISTEQPADSDSPDPEYEDTADLASSIAKLRSLLQQRSSESNLSTPALSPMPEDYIQKQVESENVSDVEAMEVDGMMPNFYKFCAKTASGVLSNTLNTIKTALPGNNPGQVYTVERWKFKTESQESETLIRMKKLLSERKEYCILDKEIDTGYDALDSVDIFQQSPVLISNVTFEDELDDFEGKIPVTKVLLDIFCELLADSNSPLIQEPVIKGILLTCGSYVECKIENQIHESLAHFAEHLVTIPETSNTNVLLMDLDDYIEAMKSGIPDLIKYVFRKHVLHNTIKLFISSLQKKKINQDVVLQVFELVAMKLIEESTQVSPPASA
ncbi:uncharacterized protein LOC115890525 isoform X2 [Sitophilus oryzae]|uniref:Uncharacterized protein LOC115890525 isoform X2 n=1 Tax=Sitophilus oryzae TaxID=7048 RepID=A0A6J2YUW6_SITOR|nr:uncharacterized protein LOC115890525 isoform X2 [Sitophilus oryzae]